MSQDKTVPVQKNSVTSFRQETLWYSHTHKTLFLISPGWPNPAHVGRAKHRSEVSSDEIPEPAQSSLLTHNYILSLLIFNFPGPDQSKTTALLYHLRTSTRTDIHLICRPERFWVNQSMTDLWLIRGWEEEVLSCISHQKNLIFKKPKQKHNIYPNLSISSILAS